MHTYGERSFMFAINTIYSRYQELELQQCVTLAAALVLPSSTQPNLSKSGTSELDQILYAFAQNVQARACRSKNSNPWGK
jgi:hypothetical protein